MVAHPFPVDKEISMRAFLAMLLTASILAGCGNPEPPAPKKDADASKVPGNSQGRSLIFSGNPWGFLKTTFG